MGRTFDQDPAQGRSERLAKRGRRESPPLWASNIYPERSVRAPSPVIEIDDGAALMADRIPVDTELDASELMDDFVATWSVQDDGQPFLMSSQASLDPWAIPENLQEQPNISQCPQISGQARRGTAWDAAVMACPDNPLPQGPSQPDIGLSPLLGLGYSEEQAKAIKGDHRAEVIKHHGALIGLKFDHAQIVKMSRRAPSLGYLAQVGGAKLVLMVNRDDIADIAKGRRGELALREFLEVADTLKAKPLELSNQQLVQIAKRGERPALQAVCCLGAELIKPPYHLSREQVVAIASCIGGKQALSAVKAHWPQLTKEPYSLSNPQVVALASHHGGAQTLMAVKVKLPKLMAAPYHLSRHQVVSIASHHGGQQALLAVEAHLPRLIAAPFGLGLEQVVAIASKDGGRQALVALEAQLPILMAAPFHLSTDQVAAIACHDGGKQALKAIELQLPKLTASPYKLSRNQVVGIASHPGGKQALFAIEVQLPTLLAAPYGLSTHQVVAIASNDGGKQALEAVKMHLTSLMAAPYNLSRDQVVAIASNNSGRQALQAVKALLPKLMLAPYHLSVDEVVAIASTAGGKSALEAAYRQGAERECSQ